MNVQDTLIAASAPMVPVVTDFQQGYLQGGDFLRLMIEELIHQDPLDPIKNEELLAQVSQIKNMETLERLDKTLSGMTYQQRIATGGALMGKLVSGISRGGALVSGVVVKVLAEGARGVSLVTDGGETISVDNVNAIQEVWQDA